MRKIYLSAAVLMGLTTAVQAQKLYLDAKVGYAFGFPGTVLGTQEHTEIYATSLTDIQRTTDVKNITGTQGVGLNFMIAPGYMFNKHFGVELGLEYYMGLKTRISEATSNITIDIPAMGINLPQTEYRSGWGDATSSQFRLIPTLVVSSGGEKFNVYAKAGLILPVWGVTKVHRTVNDANINYVQQTIERSNTETDVNISGKFNVGFRGVLGVEYKPIPRIGIFAEAFITVLQVKRNTLNITSHVVDGVETVDAMDTYDKETTYVNDYNSATINNKDINPTGTDVNRPKEEITPSTNFNQLGLSIGVRINLWNKK